LKSIPIDLLDAPRARTALGVTPDNPLSVLDLTLRTREAVESRVKSVWVRGEISDFKRHRNGHWYFCLRDRDAQIPCVVWLSDQYRLPAAPDDGMQVVLFGSMTVFAARGTLQLKVTRIDAEGDGLWRKAMELTLAKLRKEGLLDPSRKRAIPRYPRCIGVVTSPDGAALRDIVAVMRKRNFGARIVVCPAQVQGDVAAGEIAAAIRRIGRWGKADVLIVGRGGGSKDDLWRLSEAVLGRVREERHGLKRLGRSIAQSSSRLVAHKKAQLVTSAARLNALSPLATLSRGYAVARDQEGRALTSATQFAPGADFELLLHDGQVSASTRHVSTNGTTK